MDMHRLNEREMTFVGASWTQGPDRSKAFVSIEKRRDVTVDVPLADLLELIEMSRVRVVAVGGVK